MTTTSNTPHCIGRIAVLRPMLFCASVAGLLAHAAIADPGKPAASAPQRAGAQKVAAASNATGPRIVEPPADEQGSDQVSDAPSRVAPPINVLLAKATVLRMAEPIIRISIGNPAIADVTLISPREAYVLGKDLGTTNMIVWTKAGSATIVDVRVSADPVLLENELRTMLPTETDIHAKAAADSIVLTGTVADSVKADQAVLIAEAWIRRLTRGLVAPISVDGSKGGTNVAISESQSPTQTAAVAGPRVVNLLQVRDPQQVSLEVKVAEISKSLLDKLGFTIAQQKTAGDATFGLLSTSAFLNQLLGSASISTSARNFIQADGQRDDGLIKLLAEPVIMAISGQEASFNAGGKIFVPVGRANDIGGTTITLEEKEFGVGVQFKPTVLEGGRINLKVASRVSEPVTTGTAFSTINGVTSVFPSFTERRAETTVQLNDGQSFMIAGLIKSDASSNIRRFPGLGDIPILGALFRSSEFQKQNTELMFVITPRLVKPLPPDYALPTDSFVEPTRKDYFLDGKNEGATSPAAGRAGSAGSTSTNRAKQSGGFQMK